MRFSGSGPQHLGILGNFVAAILRGEPLIAPAVEGIKSVELANAMIRSAMLEHTVELPIDSIAYAALLEELMAGSKVRFAAGGNHF
jgi:hypothetical protein